MSHPLPRVYVILINWKGWELTLECLESLLRQDYPDFQVIVCDNGSPDDSVDRIRRWAAGELPAPAGAGPLRTYVEPPVAKPVAVREMSREEAERGGGESDRDAAVLVIRNGENLGFAGGNNVGLRYVLARGDAEYVWVLNNDTIVAPDALRHMVAVAEADPELGMIGSKLVYYDDPGIIQAVAGGGVIPWQGRTRLTGAGERDRGQWNRAYSPEYVHGASLLVRERLCREVGLFDERYFIYFEEVDWAVRARRAGWKLGYASDSTVWHKESRTMGLRSPFQDYHSLHSTLLFTRKFTPGLLPVVFAYTLYRHFLPKLVRRQPDRIGAVLRAYRDFLRRRGGTAG